MIIQFNAHGLFMFLKLQSAQSSILTHLSLASLLWDIGKQNSPATDVTQQNTASHLGLFCLLREFSSKN